eukprot:854256-Pelagomonas_calceolata.AAC.1
MAGPHHTDQEEEQVQKSTPASWPPTGPGIRQKKFYASLCCMRNKDKPQNEALATYELAGGCSS